MKRAVLLDLDGTLTDSRPGAIASYTAALRGLGHEPDPATDMTALIGPPIEDVMRALLTPFGDDRIAAAVALYREHYGRIGLYDNSVYPGISAALDALIAAGATLFLATSKRRVFAERILAHFGLAARFRTIYGSEPGGAIDHKPELIAHILLREGIAPGQALMVGDRRFDISGAHANGLRAIGVLWGYGSRTELEQAGADALAASPAELPALA